MNRVGPSAPSAGASTPASAQTGGGAGFRVRNPQRFALIAAALVLVSVALGAWTHQRLEQIVKPQLRAVLTTTLASATAGVRRWIDTGAQAATAAARDPRLIPLLAACVREATCDLSALRAGLLPYAQTAGVTQAFVLDAEGQLRAALALVPEPSARGERPRFPDASLEHATRLALTPAGVLPPVDAASETLLLRAPLWAVPRSGARPPTLVLGLPRAELSALLRPFRPGNSGETYAFDRQARMLSESRFAPRLVGSDVFEVNAGAHAAPPPVVLRDPGGDLTRGYRPAQPRSVQPLTFMAAHALAGGAGSQLEPYRDYRGIEVTGAYHWLRDLDLGITTELDARDAYRTLAVLKHVFSVATVVLSLAAFALLVLLAFSARLRQRTRRAERLAARFGQYRVVRKIGEGGMGSVYLATHELLRRPAAIKLLRADRVGPEAIADFEREVQITSTLNHPNTIDVYDYGRAQDGTLYYVMEYLEGLDLQRLVERFGPLPPARVVHLLRQLCGSLSEAHGAGLVHRDIKPANLLLCTRGGVRDTLKVLDFGLAVIRQPLEQPESAGRPQALPQLSIGTPEYMAPEVFESATEAGVQSDLYAIGAVAYFLLTGRPPFDGANAAELCLAHLTRKPEPPSSVIDQDIDPALERIVLSCLAKRREARPTSAAALRTLLDRSPLSGQWHQADAETWWQSRSAELEEWRASQVPSPPGAKLPPAIRPIADSGGR